jgi:ABC-type lipoprotein release transport system permease subunit
VAAVRLRLGSELRSRWKGWLAVALLVGLFAGAVIAAAAGARRTETSYTRFLQVERAPDVLVFSTPSTNETVGTFASLTESQLVGLPGVATVGAGATVGVAHPAAVNIIAPADTRVGTTLLRRKMLAGRLPRPDRLDEVTVSFVLASAQHVHVGDNFHLDALAADGGTKPYTFKIVGIDAAPTEFPPQEGTGVQALWVTPAFYRAEVGGLVSYGTTAIRLRHGLRDFQAFQTSLRALAGGKVVQSFPLADQTVNTQHSIHLQAVALWMLAGLLGITGVLVLIQLLTRQSVLESAEYPALRALGMSRSQLWILGALRGVIVGVAGAASALLIAYLLSPLLPIGLARTAEPHPGFAVDATALGIGALITAVLVAVTAAWPAWRVVAHTADPAEDGRSRPSVVADVLARPSTSAPVMTGVRLALEPGRGRTAVPVRSTIAGAVVGVAALATAFAFTASLNHLLDSPRLYGASFNASIDSLTGGDDVGRPAPIVADDSRTTRVSTGFAGFPVTIANHRVDGIAMSAIKGRTLMPTPLSGRVPVAPDEVMLGAATVSELHTRIGSTLKGTIADSGEPISFRVVGVGVFPTLSDAMGLGKGIAMTPEGLERALPPGAEAPPRDHLLIEFRSGTNVAQAVSDLDRRMVSAYGAGVYVVSAPDKPVDLVNFGRVQSLPLVLAALLGTLAVATLAHLMVTSIRRRRRDLAVLKTLGFSSRQVRSTVAWQATTLGVVAAVIGIPIGIASGRWVWIVFARQLGIVPRPTAPFLAFVVLAATTLVVANLVAILPARAAARVRPAPVLRSE